MKTVNVNGAPGAIGPYSHAAIAGDLLFVSGQLGINPETGELEEGLEAQTHRVFKNLQAVLEAAGASLDSVAKTLVFLADMNDFVAVNDVYKQYFTSDYPARSAVEVARLPKDAKIEIEAIAIVE